eukprot:2250720-Prymnesium_polylepis.1
MVKQRFRCRERAVCYVEADVRTDVEARAEQLAEKPGADAVVTDSPASQPHLATPCAEPVGVPPSDELILGAVKAVVVADVRQRRVRLLPERPR